MEEFLSERLEEKTPHKTIWDEFHLEPEENAPSLAGILEVLFEAQPAVRRRADGFMRKITAIEAQQSDHQEVKPGLENSISTETSEVQISNDESGEHISVKGTEKDHAVYLYGNEREGFETVQKGPDPKRINGGDDFQIILTPDDNVPHPHIFTHLKNVIEQSDNFSIEDKHHLQEQLNEIHLQLTGESAIDDVKLANAFEEIWEIEALYANALVESLKRDIEKLPIQSQDLIIQMQIPQER
jgi:hypothetical protein